MGRKRRRKAKPTDDWQELLPLFEWPEQQAYEELRPMVLFGGSVTERAAETGTPERTMYRRIERFEKDGMLSLFATDPAAARARRRGLEPAIRRMVVELKAEHPKLNVNETSNIVYVRTRGASASTPRRGASRRRWCRSSSPACSSRTTTRRTAGTAEARWWRCTSTVGA